MVNLKVVVSFLCIISISALYSQEKKKVFLANLQIGKSDISKEKQIDAIISESISEIPQIVGKRLENFFSLYDMAGNVGEFCEKSGTSIGYCGGTWASMNRKNELQSSSFIPIKRAQKKPNVGFRLVYAPNEL